MGVIFNTIPKSNKEESVSVTADGVKKRSALFSELFALVDTTKVKSTTNLEEVRSNGTTIVYHILSWSASAMRFGNAHVYSTSNGNIENIQLGIVPENWVGNFTTSFSYTSRINEVPQSGYMYKVVY